MNVIKYSAVPLVLVFLVGPFPSRAEETTVVGDHAPGQDYRPIIENGRPSIPDFTLSFQTDPLVVQNQILQSAAQFHQVRISVNRSSSIIGPLGGLPASVIAKPASTSSSSPSSSSSLPPDPNFSYLPLLIGTLPFVQEIRQALAQAASLAALAASVGGALGLAYLTARSNLLQNAYQNAWQWMMDNVSQGNVPQVMTYQTAFGNSIGIYDTFAPNATSFVLTPADLASMKQFLDNLPQALLQNISVIVNGPVQAMTGYGSLTGGSQISIGSPTEINGINFSHEIGVTFWESDLFQDGPLGQEWEALWNQSTDPVWDTADTFSNFPPRPMPANQPIPWGDISIAEDFATIFNDWVNESAAPALSLSLNPPTSTSIIEQAAYAATQGHTILLQKVLLMAALFTDQATQELSLYNYQNYQTGNTIERTLSKVQSSPISLTLGDFTFTIQDGLLTGASTPSTKVKLASGAVQNIPAINYTFQTPVPIPAFAANIWGIN